MPEAIPNTASAPKAKFKPAASSFEAPKFDMPKMEVPAAFREIAEKGIAQAKELAELAQKVATESAEPMKEKIGTAMNKVAA